MGRWLRLRVEVVDWPKKLLPKKIQALSDSFLAPQGSFGYNADELDFEQPDVHGLADEFPPDGATNSTRERRIYPQVS